jgi:myosin heavy subunit
MGSVSSFNAKIRPASRTASRLGTHVNEEEVERLKAKLEDRDRQLKEQATALAEMEGNLTELQGLIEQTNGLQFGSPGANMDDQDAVQLRALLREKNEKIAMLTAEFDAHRADFRSTIDTLEMASTETERVYEKRIEELMQEIQELQDRTADVDNVANQLKQLEELVQELEEGLEDARRGEAEARGEVEFLRGEVERTRSELRREREKAQASMNGSPNGTKAPSAKELEQKDDEIRGLKAIIHSLSRDSAAGGDGRKNSVSLEDRLAREKLEREVAELKALVNNKTGREEELERELESLRRGSAATNGHRGSTATIIATNHNNTATTNGRNSLRDSRGTVLTAPRSPEAQHKPLGGAMRHSRNVTLETMPESDTYSSVTENSTLWCEICETSGHDILTCTNMFGPGADPSAGSNVPAAETAAAKTEAPTKTNKDTVREELDVKSLTVPNVQDEDGLKPAPLSPMVKPAATPPPTTHIIPNPMESGPVAGKESGVVDADKWCALCELDGHDSVDCPFEDAF